MAKLRPIGDRLIVREERITMLPSGIVLPESAQAGATQVGTILRAGAGPRSPWTGDVSAMDAGLREGTRVLFGQHVGTEIEVNGEKLLALREMDIIASIEGDGEDDFADVPEAHEALTP